MRKMAMIFMAGILLQGCLTRPNASHQELGDDYYRDLEYNPADGRYYHKTPPPDASDTEYGTPRTYQDLD